MQAGNAVAVKTSALHQAPVCICICIEDKSGSIATTGLTISPVLVTIRRGRHIRDSSNTLALPEMCYLNCLHKQSTTYCKYIRGMIYTVYSNYWVPIIYVHKNHKVIQIDCISNYVMTVTLRYDFNLVTANGQHIKIGCLIPVH